MVIVFEIQIIKLKVTVISRMTFLGMVTILWMVAVLGMALVLRMVNVLVRGRAVSWTPWFIELYLLFISKIWDRQTPQLKVS